MTRKALAAVPAGAMILAAFAAPMATSASTVKRHHRRHHAHVRSAVTTATVNCTGTQSTNVPGDLNVPSGKTCTVKAISVGHNIDVNRGATLIDQGAQVANDIQATSPMGMGIGASTSGAVGKVGHDVQISGTSGAGPGTVKAGSNYVCATQVGHDLSVTGSTSAAGQWIIGDRDEDCSAGADLIGNNLYVQTNKNRVDVSDNKTGVPPYMGGIGDNLYVTGNAVNSTTPIVESNFIGDSATCQIGTKLDGDGTHNIVGFLDLGCP